MDRLVQRLAPAELVDRTQRGRRQHAERAGRHRRAIGQDVAEDIAGDHHIELPGLPHDLHRGVVDIHMRELDIGKFRFMQRDDFLAPQHAGLQHVGLVDRTDLVPSRPRQFESGARDAANLISGVLFGVEAAALPVGERLDAARLAEIDAAGQFADDDEIDVPQHAGLERRGIRQRRMGNDRPEIGVEIVFAAQAEQAPRLARRGRHFLRLRAAGRAPQDRVGLLHRLDGVRRHHLAGRKIRNDAVLRFAQTPWERRVWRQTS